MVDVALMIEGQSGLTGPLAAHVQAAEGFAGVVSLGPPDRGTAPTRRRSSCGPRLPGRREYATHRVRPLVSPLTFGGACANGRLAGRVVGRTLHLGVGAGWSRREHAMYGFDVPAWRSGWIAGGGLRITALCCVQQAVNVSGRHFAVQDAVLVPQLAQPRIAGGGSRPQAEFLSPPRMATRELMFVSPAELRISVGSTICGGIRSTAAIRRTVMEGVEGRTGRRSRRSTSAVLPTGDAAGRDGFRAARAGGGICRRWRGARDSAVAGPRRH